MKRISFILCLVSVFTLVMGGSAMAQELTEEELLQLAEDMKEKATEYRGLEFRQDVPVGVMSRGEIQEFVDNMISEVDPEMMANEQTALVKFGVFPEDQDLAEVIAAMYGEGIGGFYDPQEEHLRLVAMNPDDMSAEMRMQEAMLQMMGVSTQGMVMVHELTHALDDQYYDLYRFKATCANSDEEQARTCLIEGGASCTQYDYILEPMGLSSLRPMPGMDQASAAAPGMENMPPFLAKSMIFPYIQGFKFVVEMRKADGGEWNAYNHSIENDPPTSTEQIMHPEKFIDPELRDNPQSYELADLDPVYDDNWMLCSTNVMGELGCKLMFEHFISEENAARAAAGWDGDTYYVLKHVDTGDVVLLWCVTMDSEEDAAQFLQSYHNVLSAKYGYAEGSAIEGGTKFVVDGFVTSIEAHGTDVWVMETVPSGLYDGTRGLFENATKADFVFNFEMDVEVDAETGEFNNDMLDVSATIPEGFEVSETTSTKFVFTHEETGAFIDIRRIVTDMDASDFGNDFRKRLRDAASDVRLRRATRIEVDGQPAFTLVYIATNSKGEQYYVKQVFVQREGYLVSASCRVSEDHREDLDPIFDDFIDSLKSR